VERWKTISQIGSNELVLGFGVEGCSNERLQSEETSLDVFFSLREGNRPKLADFN